MSAYTTGTRKSSDTSTGSTVARNTRRQRSRGKYRPGSPGEEMALVEHLKGMSLTAGAKRELKSLLVSLVMLGKEETARKLQHVGENFQLSHMAAVRLAEGTMSNDSINEHAHTCSVMHKKLKLNCRIQMLFHGTVEYSFLLDSLAAEAYQSPFLDERL